MVQPLTKKIILISAITIFIAVVFIIISFLPAFLIGIGMSRSAERDKKFFEDYKYVFDLTTQEAIERKQPELCANLIHYKYFFTDMGCDSCFSRYYRNECLAAYRNKYPDSSVCHLFSPAAETPGYDGPCKEAVLLPSSTPSALAPIDVAEDRNSTTVISSTSTTSPTKPVSSTIKKASPSSPTTVKYSSWKNCAFGGNCLLEGIKRCEPIASMYYWDFGSEGLNVCARTKTTCVIAAYSEVEGGLESFVCDIPRTLGVWPSLTSNPKGTMLKDVASFCKRRFTCNLLFNTCSSTPACP